MRQFIRRHTWVLPLAVVVVGFVALLGVFAVAPGSPMRAPEPAPAVVFEPEETTPPVEATGSCEALVAEALDIQADLLEVDVESAAADAQISALNRRLAALLRQQSASGCI